MPINPTDSPEMPSESEVTRRRFLGWGAAVAAVSAVSVGEVAAELAPMAKGDNSRRGPEVTSLFRSKVLNDETLFALGAASYGGSEVGEVLELVQRVRKKTGNPLDPTERTFNTLVGSWERLGRSIEREAKRALADGHLITARDRFFRASTYFDQSLFFVLGTSKPDREEGFFKDCQRNWLSAISLWKPKPLMMTIRVGNLDLPGYFFRPDQERKKRPTLIFCNGSDGQNCESLGFGLAAGLERGYNVFVFEGPGQMSLLFEQKIPFARDWAPILSAITQALRQRPEVDPDRIAAAGLSFLGMVLASAAASGSGLAACILEPGAHSLADAWTDPAGIKAAREAQGAPTAVRNQIRAEVNAGFLKQWPDLPRSVQFTISKRSELYAREFLEAARAGRPPDYFALMERLLDFEYAADLEAITIPTLVIQNQGDEFFKNQSRRAFELLTSLPRDQKRLIELTRGEGANLHNQPIGMRVAQEIIFDWLDEKIKA